MRCTIYSLAPIGLRKFHYILASCHFADHMHNFTLTSIILEVKSKLVTTFVIAISFTLLLYDTLLFVGVTCRPKMEAICVEL